MCKTYDLNTENTFLDCKEYIFCETIVGVLEQNIKYPTLIKADTIRAMYIKQSMYTQNIILWESSLTKIEFVRSENNYSDIFTKKLGNKLFEKHSEKLMEMDTENMTFQIWSKKV